MIFIRYRKSLYSHLDTKKVNLGRALKKLTGSGVLYRENNNYFLSYPMFELWIKEKIING